MRQWLSEDCAYSWGPFPSVGLSCSASMGWVLFNLIIFYFIMLVLFPRRLSFLMRDRKGPELEGGRGTGGVEGRETIARIYHMRKNLFSITGKSGKELRGQIDTNIRQQRLLLSADNTGHTSVIPKLLL